MPTQRQTSNGMRPRHLLLFLALLVAPFVVTALSLEEIQERIRSMLLRVAQLKQELQQIEHVAESPPPLPANLPCLSLGRTLQRDMWGEDVKKLQEFLIGAGLLSKGNATAYFGPATEAAVQRWQVAAGTVRSGTPSTTGFGLVGPKTREAILTACKRKVIDAPSASPAGTPARVCSEEASVPTSACEGLWRRRLDSNGCVSGYACVEFVRSALPQSNTTTSGALVFEPYTGVSVVPISYTNTTPAPPMAIDSSTSAPQYVDINVTAYPAAETSVASGHSSRCPQEGWRAYLACPYGGCTTGWNICRGGVWILDSVQQTYLVGAQGPCESGQIWCGIATGYGCVAANLCVNGKAL